MSVPAETQTSPHEVRRLDTDKRWVLSLVAILVAELLFFNFGVSTFWGGGWGSSVSMLGDSETFLFTSVIALGVMFVIFAGDIDLSVGAMSGFAGVMMAEFHIGGMNIWVAVVISLLIAALIGLIQGLIITYFKLESLLVTLAGWFILQSAAVAWEGPAPPYNLPKHFESLLGTGTIGGTVPNQLVIFAILALLAMLIVHRTRFGRRLVLVGYNRDAAGYAGVRVSVTRIRAFMLSATFAAFAGLCIAATYGTARDDLGPTLLLPAITAVVLGGVDIFGGAGLVAGVVVASFILGWLTPGLLQDGVGDTVTNMSIGVLLLVSLTVKGITDRRQGGSFRERLRGRFDTAAPTAPPTAPDTP
ncbi:MAG TPA: ABC transporter permease [Solirubrobacteraceae bacterium]|nr:ABC transporter permease [Solirubrobacteraceae bacterium]